MYRRVANKGTRCSRWQRVPGPRGRGRVLRCRRFHQPGKPTGLKPANYGKTCRRMRRFYGPWYNKKVLRCVSYGAGAKKRRRSSGGRGRGYHDKRETMQRRPTPAPRPAPQVVYDEPAFHIPLSFRSIEKTTRGRTPVQMTLKGTRRRKGGINNPRQLTFSY